MTNYDNALHVASQDAPIPKVAASKSEPEMNVSAAEPVKQAAAVSADVSTAAVETRVTLANLPSVWDLPADIEWVVESMIPAKTITLLSAESGTGKTWVAYALAAAVAYGRPFAGHVVKAALPVLYMDGENPLAVARRNLDALGVAKTDALQIWGGWNVEPAVGPDDKRIVEFAEKAKGLIIWDPLVEFHTGDEQSSTDTRRLMKLFRRLTHLGATVIILCHTGKTSSSKPYRGSSDIKASVDTAYELTGTPQNGRIWRIEMRNFKSRIAEGRNFGLEFHEGEGFGPCGTNRQADALRIEDVIDAVIAQQPGINQKTLIEQVQAQYSDASRGTITEALRLGPWRRERGTGKTLLYSPPPAAPAEPAA